MLSETRAIRARANDSIRVARQMRESLTPLLERMRQDDPHFLRRYLHSMLMTMVDSAIQITGADMANLQLFDPASAALCIEAQRGFSQPFLEFFGRVNDEHAACGTAFKSRKRVIVEDVSESTIFLGMPALEVMLDAGARAVQSTPLVGSSGCVLGMISTHWNRPWRPCNRHLLQLDLLARNVARWIEQRWLVQRIGPGRR